MRIKRILISIWNEFIYGSHFISLAGSSISVIGAFLLGIELTWPVPVIFYLLLQIGFFYNRYKDFNKDFLTNPERTQHIKRYIKYLPVIIFLYSVVFTLILAYYGNLPSIILGLAMLFLALLYSEIAKEITKKIFLFKELYFAACWGLLILLLALFYSNPISIAVILLIIFVCLRIFLSTSLFDIKDIISDKNEKLKTLPVLIGEKKAYNFLAIFSFLVFIPLGIGICLDVFPLYTFSLILIIPYTLFYIYQVKKKEMDPITLHYFIIGGEFNFYLFFLILGKLLWNF